MRLIPTVPRRLRWLPIAVAPVIVALVAIVAVTTRSQASAATSEQPLPFSHKAHSEAGIECVYCHAGVLRSAVAGLPSMQLCVGCHENITPEDPAVQADIDKVLAAWEGGEPVRWVRITNQPDFVYFTHHPHIRQGVACETCHGNVSEMDWAEPAFTMNMGFCLACHREMATDPVHEARLVDCATCHQ